MATYVITTPYSGLFGYRDRNGMHRFFEILKFNSRSEAEAFCSEVGKQKIVTSKVISRQLAKVRRGTARFVPGYGDGEKFTTYTEL